MPVALFLAPLLVIVAASPTMAQTALALTGSPQLAGSAPAISGVSSLLGVATAIPTATVAAPGTLAFEMIRGNGTRTGYLLTHNAVLPDTLSVHAGGMRLQSGVDYYFDPATGNLYFVQPVRAGDTVSVSYRYLDSPDAQKQFAPAAPGLLLNFGQHTQMGLLFGMTSTTGTGYNSTLSGMALSSSFGTGNLSHYSGMAYFSNMQANTNQVVNIHSGNSPTSPAAKAAGQDLLLAQNLAMQSGALHFNADFQDVGKNFTGFSALKQNYAGNKSQLDQLTTLEAEKGIKRLGFGLGMAANPKAPTSGALNFNWSQIQDAKDQIQQLGATYSNSVFNFQYGSRTVGAKFTQFAGLREADKAQWMHEAGLTTDNIGLGLRFGTPRKGVLPGTLGFQQQNFTDKSGSLQRNLFTVDTSTLGLSYLHSASNKGFKRMGDLSDADKTALALDIYHQYDPHADAKLVTPDDKAQIAKEAGLDRDALHLGLGMGKQGALDYVQSRVAATQAPVAATSTGQTAAAAAPALSRDSLGLHLGALNFSMVERRTDAGFTRIGDLTDIERRYIALDIRRQFDPTVTPDKITPKERDDAAANEAGLQRTGLLGTLNLGGKNNKRGTLTFGQFDITSIAPATASTVAQPQLAQVPSVTRQMLSYVNPTLQMSLTRQLIGGDFSRLGSLSAVEKAQFGNERGLQHNQFSFLWQPGHGIKIGLNGLQVNGSEDAKRAAVVQAIKNNQDPIAALHAAAAGTSSAHFNFEAKGLQFGLARYDTDKLFARAADLALPDADKSAINIGRGFQRTDETLHLDRIKGLVIDSTGYTAHDAIDKLMHEAFKRALTYTPNKALALSYTADSDIATANNAANGTSHSLLTVKDTLNKQLAMNLSAEDHQTLANGATTEHTEHDVLHIEGTQKLAGTNLNLDVQDITYAQGKYQNTANLNIHAKPTSNLTVQYSLNDLDRTPDPTQKVEAGKTRITESTEGYGIEFQATKQFAVVFGGSDTNTNDSRDANTLSVGLKGEPFKNITLAAKFDEQHHTIVGNTKDVADFAISNTKPFSFGPLKELTVKAGYTSLNDKGKLQNENMTGHASWKLWKNEFVLDYNGVTTVPGQSTTSRLYSFTTDPNPKHWFHSSWVYKVRTLVTGKDMLIRQYAADARLTRRTSFTYTYGTLPEDAKGNIQPLMTEDIALKQVLTPKVNGLFFYRVNNNTGTKILTRSLGIGAQGDLSKTSKLELTLSTGADGFVNRYDRSNQLKLAFTQKLSADNYLSLSTEMHTHDGKAVDGTMLKDEYRADLDLNFRF